MTDTEDAIMWVYDDGGRRAAGFGQPGSHAARAVAIASGREYRWVYDRINTLAKLERTGKRKRDVSDPNYQVYGHTMKLLMQELGATWTPTMTIGSVPHMRVAMHEMPPGRLVLNLRRHYVAVIDGVLHDMGHCARDGSRIVYGYWTLHEDEPED